MGPGKELRVRKPVVDHLWSKIFDLDTQGRSAAEHKLKEVIALSQKITQSEGSEVANNVLSHGLIETALHRCVQIQDGQLELNYDDLQIYATYATTAMRHAQAVIDKELGYLEL